MKTLKKPKNGSLTRSYLRMGWFVLCLAMVLSSCAKEADDIISTGDDEASLIVPEALVADVVETKADLGGLVVGTSFPANYTNVFSVVGYRGTAAPTNDWSSPYIDNVAVNSGANGVLSFATPQYYPVNGDKVYFYAYSPVSGTYYAGNGTTTPKVAWTINGQQDIMVAQITNGIAKNRDGSQPTFTFEHKLMQVQFTFKKSAECTADLRLRGLYITSPTNVTLDLSTGNITTSTTAEWALSMWSLDDNVSLTTNETKPSGPVLIPHSQTLPIKVGITDMADQNTINELTGIVNLPANAGPGKQVQVDVIINQQNIEVTSVSISPTSIPQAGANLAVNLQTSGNPSSPITITAKTADGTTLASGSGSSNYKVVNLPIPARNDWGYQDIQLYWSYKNSAPAPVGDKFRQYGWILEECEINGQDPEYSGTPTLSGGPTTVNVKLVGTLPETFTLICVGPYNFKAESAPVTGVSGMTMSLELPRSTVWKMSTGWRIQIAVPGKNNRNVSDVYRGTAEPGDYEIWGKDKDCIIHVAPEVVTSPDTKNYCEEYCSSRNMTLMISKEKIHNREYAYTETKNGFWAREYDWAYYNDVVKGIRGGYDRDNSHTPSDQHPAHIACVFTE